VAAFFLFGFADFGVFGLVATFNPSVSLLPTMYSPANWADHRKLDSGERDELYAFGGQTGG
jgi:hypothetical protein